MNCYIEWIKKLFLFIIIKDVNMKKIILMILSLFLFVSCATLSSVGG